MIDQMTAELMDRTGSEAPARAGASTAPPALPEWALVLSTYRRADVLMSCLRATLGQTRPPREIIIVDASPDWAATAERVMSTLAAGRPEITWHYVEAERRSLPAQRNQGIALSTAPILFMIDDDSIMHPDCAERVLEVYAADVRGEIAGVGPHQVHDFPDLDGVGPALAEAAAAARRAEDEAGPGEAVAPAVSPAHPGTGLRAARRWVRWWVSTWFDRGTESFLPYEGAWPDRPIPAECAGLDVSRARVLNGFRMTYRREVIAREGFLDWFVGYAPLEDLDASYRASRHGALVNAHAARLCHLTHAGGRPKHFAVAAQWVMSNAVLHAVFGRDRGALAATWRWRVGRFLFQELVKDVAKRRLTLPNFRGMYFGARRLAQIHRMPTDELREWYPLVQSGLMSM